MEIVINRCYGGYSLSALAVAELAKRKGKTAYFFTGGFADKLKRVDLKDLTGKKATLFFSAYSDPNAPKLLEYPDGKTWYQMTQEERGEYNERYKSLYLSASPEDRTDPDLIAVVHKLGEKANGACAELDIVEIPNGVEWEIDEYDGIERIAEKHRTWS